MGKKSNKKGHKNKEKLTRKALKSITKSGKKRHSYKNGPRECCGKVYKNYSNFHNHQRTQRHMDRLDNAGGNHKRYTAAEMQHINNHTLRRLYR